MRITATLIGILYTCQLYSQTITSTTSGGNWNSGSTWVGGSVPSSGAEVVIADGATVSITSNQTCASLQVGEGASGILEYHNGSGVTLTVNGNISVSSGAVFRAHSAPTANRTHSLSVSGSIINNGTLTFYYLSGSYTSVVNTTLAGSTAASYSGSGSTLLNNLVQANSGGFSLGANLALKGNFTVNSSRSFDLGGYTLTIGGSYTNSGTLTANAFGSTLHFNGGAAQTLTGGSYTGSFIANVISNNTHANGLNLNVNAANSIGNITVNSGAYLQAANVLLNVKGNIVNNGTFFTNGGNGSTQLAINGSSQQTISGSGSFAQITTNAGAGRFPRMTVDNAAGLVLNQDITIQNVLNLTIGEISGSATLTLGTGASSTLAITRLEGFLSVSTTHNLGNVTCNITYGNSSGSIPAISTGAELPSTVSGVLTLKNPSGVFLGSSTSLTSGSNGLVLTGTVLTLGSNDLTLGINTTISGTASATNMIAADGSGQLKKTYKTGATSFTFPVGDAGGHYSRAVVNLATNSVERTIGLRVVNSAHPQNGSATDFVNRYWVFTDNQAGTGTYTFNSGGLSLGYSTVSPGDANGTPAIYKINRWDGSNWTQLSSSHSAPNVSTSAAYNQTSATLGGNEYTLRANTANSYTWQAVSGTADFADPASWSPQRFEADPSDILLFTGGGSSTATGLSTQTIGRIAVSNNTSVTFQASATTTLTLGSASGTTALGIEAGSNFNLGGSNALTLTFANLSLITSITGDLSVGSGNTLNFANLTVANNTISGRLINTGGTITATAANTKIGSGAFLEHNRDGGTIPTVTWDAASTLSIASASTPPSAGISQSFGHVKLLTGAFTTFLNGNTTVNGNLELGSNTVLGISNRTLTLKGTISGSGLLSGGASSVLVVNPAAGGSIGTLAFEPGSQTLSSLTVNLTGTTPDVNLGSDLTVNGTHTLTAGDFSIGANTLTLRGAITATSGTFTGGSTSNITFDNTGNTTLPAVSGGLNNLTVNRSGSTISLAAPLSIAGDLQINAGTLNDNGNQISGNATGILSVVAGATLSLGNGTSATLFPTDYTTANISLASASTVIYTSTSGSGVTISSAPATYGNLALNGSAIKTFAANTTLTGNFSNGPGSRPDLGDYTLQIAGTWANSGTITANATGATLTFNGSAAQNFDIGAHTGNVLTNLTLNNAAGLTLDAPLTVGNPFNGTLTLTSGILSTSASNLLTLGNTATGAVSGGSSTAYINGPLARSLPASLSGSSTYNFPVGKGAYTPFALVNAATDASGTVTAEVFDADIAGLGATPGAGMATLNSNRYWKAEPSSGFITAATVRVTEPAMSGANRMAQSVTSNGAFDAKGGGTSSPVTSTAVETGLGYFALGNSGQIFSSATVLSPQLSSTIVAGAVNEPILRIALVISNPASPALELKSLTFNTNGTTAAADIAAAKVYYTGTSSTYTATTQFGSTLSNPTSTHTITGGQALSVGTNYFWLAYDISSSAPIGNRIDAECTNLNIGGATYPPATDYTPANTAPSGNRRVDLNYCTPNISQACENVWHTAGAISSVTITDTLSALTYFSHSGVSCNGSYQDLSGSTNSIFSLAAGAAYTIKVVKNGSAQAQCAAWIDFNGNGTFANDEQIMFRYQSGNTYTATFTVPLDATAGPHRLRTGINVNNSITGYEQTAQASIYHKPCYATNMQSLDPLLDGGEFRDFTLDILDDPCVALTAGLTASGDTLYQGYLSWFTALPAGRANYTFYVNGDLEQDGTTNIYQSTSLMNGDTVKVVITNMYACKDSAFIKTYIETVSNPWQPGQELFFDWSTDEGSQEFFFKHKSATKIDGSGNVYLTGATLNQNGDYDVLVSKYNVSGTRIWASQYAGAAGGNDAGLDLVIDESGNVYVTGTSVEAASDSNDVLVLKYNSSGVLQWSETYNGAGSSHDGGVMISLNSTGEIYVSGITTGATPPLTDFLLLKYSNSGTPLWQWVHNNGLFDVATGHGVDEYEQVTVYGATQTGLTTYSFMTVTYNGTTGLLISTGLSGASSHQFRSLGAIEKDQAGNTYITGTTTVSGGVDMYTLKLDQQLNILWSDVYNSSGTFRDEPRAISIDESGSVYVAGYSETVSDGTDYKVIKYNPTGSRAWVRSFNGEGSGADTATAIVADAQGLITITGSSFNGSNEDYYTQQYDSAGTLLYYKAWNSWDNKNDRPTALTVDPLGNIIVSGQSESHTGLQYATVRYIKKATVNIPGQQPYSSALAFTENRGQVLTTEQDTISRVLYYNTQMYPAMYFMDDTVSYVFSKQGIDESNAVIDSLQRVDMWFENEVNAEMASARFGSFGTRLEAAGQTSDFTNYYYPHTAPGLERVPAHKRLIRHDTWPGIDFEFAGNEAGLKYSIIIKPDADPANIHIRYGGYSGLSVNGSGKLTFATGIGNLEQNKAVAYQISPAGVRKELNWQPDYVISDSNRVTFSNLGIYDPQLVLILSISMELGPGSCIDPEPTLGNLWWSSFYGGNNGGEISYDIAVDANNNTVLCGKTASADFPFSLGEQIQTEFGGGEFDGFAVSFNEFSARKWATYYGGDDYDSFNGVICNNSPTSNSQIYLTGKTLSTNILMRNDNINANSYNQNGNSGDADAFIVRMNMSNGEIVWSSYIGGEDDDEGRSIACDRDGNIYVALNTKSIEADNSGLAVSGKLPVFKDPGLTETYFQNYNNGAQDIFLLKFNPTNELIWGTFFGGGALDLVYEIHCSKFGNNLYMVGQTDQISTAYHSYMETNNLLSPIGENFPLVENTEGSYFQAGTNGFISRFSGNENSLIWSTNMSGVGGLQTVSSTGSFVYVGGLGAADGVLSCEEQAISTPVCGPGTNSLIGDGYIAKFTPRNELSWSTHFFARTNYCGSIYGDENLIGVFPELKPLCDQSSPSKLIDITCDGSNSIFLIGTNFQTQIGTQNSTGLFYDSDFYNYNGSDFTDAFILAYSPLNYRYWATYFGSNACNIDDPSLSLPRFMDFGAAICAYGNTDLYIAGQSLAQNGGYPFKDPGPQQSGLQIPWKQWSSPGSAGHNLNSFMARFDMDAVDLPLSINEPNNHQENEDLSVYPNPSSDRFTIILPNGFIGVCNVYNATGQLIDRMQNTTNNSFEINLEGYSKGLYFMQLIEKKTGKTKALKLILK